MKDNKKETKVKFEFKLKDSVEKIKLSCIKVKNKISENIKSGEFKKINKQSIKYYSMLLVMLVVAFFATYANIRSYKEANTEKYNTYVKEKSSNEEKSLSTSIEEQNVIGKEEKEEAIPVTSTQFITAESSIVYVDKNKNTNELPVMGSIKREYSMDKVVYYESLEVWKTHSGVDIMCDEATEVKSMLAGKVIGIYNDNSYGYSVVVESEEYTCIYSSLSENVKVNIGNKVEVGDVLGYASECVAEKEMGCHLHFEVMKDGEYVDPQVLGVK